MSEMSKNEKTNEDDKVLRAVNDAFSDGVPEEHKERLRRTLRGFRRDLAEHRYVKRLNRKARGGSEEARWFSVKRLRPSLALAAACGAVAVLLGLQFFQIPTTWASIAETFRSVKFFSAVLYQKDGFTSQPRQFELWYGHEGLVRVHYCSQVAFGHRGKVSKAFDVGNRAEVDPDPDVANMIEMFPNKPGFSLQTVLEALNGEARIDSTPEVNADAVISEDLIVFDVQSRVSSSWFRIWVLRESKLPIRIRFWNALSGYSMDCHFTYSKEQPKAFLNPDTFAKTLSGNSVRTGEAMYTQLQDPGGRPITRADIIAGPNSGPAEMEDLSKYHIPSIESVRLMEDGAVCVVATKARNTMPDGTTFSGFARIEDDLGRTYTRVYSSWHISDRSTQVFLPSDYPFDERRPTSVSLTCAASYHLSKPGETPVRRTVTVGSIRIDDLKTGMGWPTGMGDFDPRTSLAGEFLVNGKDLSRAQRILDAIEGDPSASSVALSRDRLHVELLVKRKEFDQAAEIARRVAPLLLKEYEAWSPRYRRRKYELRHFLHCLAALAGSGHIEEARGLLVKIKNAPVPNPPEKIGRRLQEKYRQEMTELFDEHLSSVAYQLLCYAGITVEQLGEILGTDVLTDPRLRDYRGNFRLIMKAAKEKQR